MSYLYSKLPETGVPSLIGTGGGRLTKIAGVLNVPVSKLLGLDEESIATSSRHENSASPLQLLTIPGALRLLRAYAKLEDGVMRRSIVAMAENVALGRGESKKRQ
jgi:hypothetical protein